MSIYIYFSVLILPFVNAQDPIQRYVVRKDFFSGLKASEFTVSDTSEKHVYYRIESKLDLVQNVKIIVYPSKQEIGRLDTKIQLLIYKAEISILDPQTKKWIGGRIQQNVRLFTNSFDIEWNGYHITLANEVGRFTVTFYDTNGKDPLAQFRIRPTSFLWTNKYDMQIFSNKYPVQLYLLGLVAYDRSVSPGTSGK